MRYCVGGLLLVLSLGVPLCSAGMVGEVLTGELRFPNVSGTTNWFAPANAHVPVAGYANIAGPTVTVLDPGVEFGYADSLQNPGMILAADLKDSTLWITAQFLAGFVGQTAPRMQFFFTPATPGLLQSVSEDFANTNFPATLGLGFAGSNTAFLSWSGRLITAPTTYTAVLDIGTADAPEPHSWVLVLLGLSVGFAFSCQRRVRQEGSAPSQGILAWWRKYAVVVLCASAFLACSWLRGWSGLDTGTSPPSWQSMPWRMMPRDAERSCFAGARSTCPLVLLR